VLHYFTYLWYWNILDLKNIENERKFTSSSTRAIYFQTVISPRIEMS
jgi:hypothetical protein